MALGALMGGCSKIHPEKGAANQMTTIRDYWLEEIEFQKEGATRETELTWDQAIALLYKDNLTLLRQREDIRRCREAIRDVYIDVFVPSLGFSMDANRQVKDLSGFRTKDIRFSFTSYLGLSSIKGFFTSIYTTKLSHLRSIIAYDMAVREQTIELYKTFFEYEQLMFRDSNLKIQSKIAQQYATVDKRKGSLMVEDTEMEAFKMEKEKRAFQDKMNRLLGSRRVNWALKKEGLPTFDYLNNPLDIYDTEKVNKRGMQLAAMELEAARLALKGIRMQYWPSINPQINFPSLLSGDMHGKIRPIHIEETTVGLSAYWSFDTKGRIGRQLRDFKFDREIQVKEARLKAQELIQKLLEAQEGLEKLEKQRGDLQRQWMLYDKLLATQGLAQYDKIISTRKTLLERQLQLNQSIADVNTFLWFLDESRWPSLQFETYKLNDPTLIRKQYRRGRWVRESAPADAGDEPAEQPDGAQVALAQDAL